jgi:alpha-tubulin suppressor-like RCC1 family protein
LAQLTRADSVPGYVIGWGNNGGGQATGVPSISFENGRFMETENSFATGAVRVAGVVINDAVSISAGFGHSLALRTDGTVAGWGGNYQGSSVGYETPYPHRAAGSVTLHGTVLDDVHSIAAARNFSLALKNDGTVVTWGKNLLPTGVTRIAAIAGDWGMSWVLKQDGTVVGRQSDPSAEDAGRVFPVASSTNAVNIAVGTSGYFTLGLALLRDGTVADWGRKFEEPEGNPPPGLSNVVAIAVGASHALAVKSDGTVIGWGWNEAGEATGIPTTGRPNLANFSSGPVRFDGQILSNVVSVAAHRGYSMALKKDGTVVAWGRMVNNLYPVTVPEGLSNVVAIAAGEDFCLAITTNKAVADRFAIKEP